MSTDPIAPDVRSKPTFIDAICTANSSATIHSARHSPFSGRSETPRQRAHRATHAIPIAKRRNAVVSGGKASRENLTATGLPPHSEWMTIETSTAPRGTESAIPEAGCPTQTAGVSTILPCASRPSSRCIACAARSSGSVSEIIGRSAPASNHANRRRSDPVITAGSWIRYAPQ